MNARLRDWLFPPLPPGQEPIVCAEVDPPSWTKAVSRVAGVTPTTRPAAAPADHDHVHVYQARRSTVRRLFIGASMFAVGPVYGAPALLAGKNQARCVICGQVAK